MLMRGSLRKSLERTIRSMLEKRDGVFIDTSKMTNRQLQVRITEIGWWDILSTWQCPMRDTKKAIRLMSQVKLALNLQCKHCGAKFLMTTCRALGAKIIPTTLD